MILPYEDKGSLALARGLAGALHRGRAPTREVGQHMLYVHYVNSSLFFEFTPAVRRLRKRWFKHVLTCEVLVSS